MTAIVLLVNIICKVFQMNISPLHAKVHFLECNFVYYDSFKQWRAHEDAKWIKQQNIQLIQYS